VAVVGDQCLSSGGPYLAFGEGADAISVLEPTKNTDLVAGKRRAINVFHDIF
jgi:hypothetical protein